MNEINLTIQLELEAHGDSISGLVRTAGGNAEAFSGWIGLIAALDTLVEKANAQNQTSQVIPEPFPSPYPAQ